MKKNITRIMACFMACIIAFNVIAIPKAKAVVTESVVVGFSPAILALYMKSAGLSLSATSSAAGAAAMTEMIGGYAAATGTTASAVTGSIAAGAAISTTGAIILTVGAVALLAAIVAWAISEYKIEPGAPETTPIYASVESLPSLPELSGSYTYALVALNEAGDTFYLYVTAYPAMYVPAYVGVITQGPDTTKLSTYSCEKGGSEWVFEHRTNHAGTIVAGGRSKANSYVWSNYDVNHIDTGEVIFASEGDMIFKDWDNPEVSAALDAEYIAPIEITETQQMVFNLGVVEGATQESVSTSIFEQVVDGTLNPTYEITDIDNGTDTNPDVDVVPDTELGLLERIANGVESLIDGIVDGIANIFAPDPALMQEIADTFTSKFGFVTTLHDLGSDLLSISADSEPPVVYIHLEDAEGNIDYGGTVKALDMTWYSRYKADADRVLSGFLWLGFVWMLFKRVPSIIKGTSMETEERSKL